VSSGGLGVCLTMGHALPAFLSSVNDALELTVLLLPSRQHSMSGNHDLVYIAACLKWQTSCGAAVPDPSRAGVQKVWDASVESHKSEESQNQAGRCRLLAVTAPHFGDFLTPARRCSSVGTRLVDTSLCNVVSLPQCMHHTHVSVACRSTALVFMALPCRKYTGSRMGHNAVNDLIKRALT